MQNLYDLLGIRPNDDAEDLRKAYRRAAKDSHPDHHGGDPGAALRFRQITEAYDILRDAGQRAAYDQLLEFERRPIRWKLKRAFSEMKRHVVYDVTAGAVLAIVLAVGYELYAGMSETPIDDAAGIAAVLPGQDGRAGRAATPQMPILIPSVMQAAAAAVAPAAAAPVAVVLGAGAAVDGGAAQMTKDEPVSAPVGPATSGAGHDTGPDTPVDPAVTKTRTADSGKDREAERREGHDVQPADVQSSTAEKHDGAGNAPPPAVTVSDDKRDRRHDPAVANTGDVKQLPELKVSARPPAAAKRPATSRPPFEQASLETRTAPAAESRSTPACPGSPSCSGDVPPLFGLGN